MTADELIGILAPVLRQERAGLARHVRYLQEEAEATSKRINDFDAALAVLAASRADEPPPADPVPLRLV